MTKPWLNINAETTDAELFRIIREIKEHFPEDADTAAELAQSLASSGTRIAPRGAFSADVASTGGPSSLSTLICPLFLAAGGAKVPKLGVPGRPAGGIDCLAQIPGYKPWMTRQDVERGLDIAGYVHFLPGPDIAPLDLRMFRLRQQSSAQDVPTLVTASLMGKKLAVGVKYAGLDIRVAPHGNFGKNWEDARQNANLFIQAGKRLEIQAAPVLTDGRYPYQPYIGRKEALLAVNKIFSGESSPWLAEHLDLCQALALSCTPLPMRERLSRATASDLQKTFEMNVEVQGGQIEQLRDMLPEVEQAHCHRIIADKDGFVFFHLESIRRILTEWQQRCIDNEHPFPDPVGIIFTKRPGEWARNGEILATLRVEGVPVIPLLNDLDGSVLGVQHEFRSARAEGISA
jgi:pyrimidine-nucleoside phosphorylase